jgi:Tol biopolymer transport system component
MATCRGAWAAPIGAVLIVVILGSFGCTPKPPYPRGSDDSPLCSATRQVLYFHGGGREDARPTGLYCFDLDSLNARLLVSGVCWYDWIPGADSVLVHDGRGTRVISSRTGRGHDLPLGVTPGRISPDGRWLAYDTTKDGHISVSLVQLATGEVRDITPDSMGYNNPSWSPAGDRLALIGSSAHLFRVLIVDTLGAPIRVIGRGSRYPAAPQWSPSGGYIAWVDGTGAPVIFVSDTSGVANRYVAQAADWYTCWETNDDALIYSRAVSGGTRLFEYNMRLGRTRQLTY